ncbi:MAG: condensation domain-containing protein, partial [Acutalibacteraceae bacterium]|nr:condensation domain-containing protein [Acutalibacteraceae bacterium]
MRQSADKPNIESLYPLTALQEGMLFNNMLDNTSQAYNLQHVTKITGVLNLEYVKQSLQLLTQRHEILRSAIFYTKVKQPMMAIFKERMPEYTEIDLSSQSDFEEKISRICKKEQERIFEFEKRPLFRVVIVKVDDENYQMIWTIHHIIVDGWSFAILQNDFKRFYQMLSSGKNFSALRIIVQQEKNEKSSYKNYIQWYKKQDHEEGYSYWNTLLSGYDNVPVIQSLQVPKNQNIQNDEISVLISGVQYENLIQFAKNSRVTLNTVLEAALGVTIQLYTHLNDVVFGSVVSGRNSAVPDIDDVAGLLINTIPVRVVLEPHMTVRDLIHSLHTQLIKSSNYDFCSLAEVLQHTNMKSSAIQTLFGFENYYEGEVSDTSQANIQFKTISEREQTEYALTFTAYEENGLVLNIAYDTKIYTAENVLQILNTFKQVILTFVAYPDDIVSSLSFITSTESQMILKKFNSTEVKYPREKTVIELFEEQVEKNPEKIAVVFENQSLTYAEINAKANQLAYKLRDLGVKPDDFVAIIPERNINTIIGVCGILKSGAAYVPLDSSYPESRIKMILKDCQPKAIL